jgi:UDP-GlcNAc3NAcA epimerase
MKIVTIVGARPQFIKAAAVSRAIAEHNRLVAGALRLSETIIHTGQHYDYEMSQIFFEELGIAEPDINLEVGSGSHGWQTGHMLIRLEKVLLAEKPDWVLVYGDTNSTLAGALAAVKLHVPVAHVEAGLRSFNRQMPEEINRVVTDHVSTLLFCPTRQAVENLKAEGIADGTETDGPSPIIHDLSQKVALVGDVMYDSVLHNIELAENRSSILEKLKLQPKGYALATIHRPENTDESGRLRSIFYALEQIAQDTLPVIVPLHPRTRSKAESLKLSLNGVQLTDPVSYLDMLLLEKQAQVIRKSKPKSFSRILAGCRRKPTGLACPV